MFQAFLNSRFPWFVVAGINFISVMLLVYLVVSVGSKYLDWMTFDATYIAAGAFWYSYLQYNSWKSHKKRNQFLIRGNVEYPRNTIQDLRQLTGGGLVLLGINQGSYKNDQNDSCANRPSLKEFKWILHYVEIRIMNLWNEYLHLTAFWAGDLIFSNVIETAFKT